MNPPRRWAAPRRKFPWGTPRGRSQPMEPRSGQSQPLPALGRRQGFAEHGSAQPQQAGYAEPAVGSGFRGR